MEKSPRFNLNEILSQTCDGVDDDTKRITHLFHSGLQEFITILSALFVAGVSNEQKVPPGFIGKFTKAFISPTLGGIFEGFLLWIASNDINPSLRKLSLYLFETEKKGKGWFVQMIQLRNKFEHPQEIPRQQIIENGMALLHSIPDLSSFGNLLCKEDDSVYWESDGACISLDPFLFMNHQSVESFREIRDDGKIVFSTDYPSKQEKFNDIWRRIRILDAQLAKPDLKDIRGKILLLQDKYNEGESPWWAGDLLDNMVACRFAESGCINNSGFVKQGDKVLFLRSKLQENELPDDLICRVLGLDSKFKAIELNSLLKDAYFILNIDAVGCSSRNILLLLLWLADNNESGSGKRIKIIIERKFEELESDQQKLWERIPENIEKLMCKSPGSKGSELRDFYWSRATKKRLFNIF